MKNYLYSITLLSLVLSCSVLTAAPLSGNYTIGGASPDYTTFTAAVAALITNGTSSAVVFNVHTGTYNEQITIPSGISGPSSSGPVTFQAESGNASDVTLTYGASGTSDNWVVKFSGCGYIIFKNLTLQATGSTYSDVVYTCNNATYNTLNGCIVTAPASSSTSLDQVLVNMDGDGTQCDHGTVINCTLANGSYGIYSNFSYYNGSSYNFYLNMTGNFFKDQYAYGIYNFRSLNATIKGNTFTSNVSNIGYYAINLTIAFYDSISDNNVYKSPGNGIYYDNGEPHIFNNFIEIEGNGNANGLIFTDINYSATITDITANTVLDLNTNPNSAAFYFPAGYNQPLNFLHDNIFVNRGGGYAINIVNTSSLTSPNGWGVHPSLDYNDYYATGQYIGNWGGTNCTTLANWQTTINGCGCGADANSINVNPSFVSDTDLHLTVDNVRFGVPASDVKYDIDNEKRNITTPDIGADEFGGTGTPPPVAKFTSSGATICAGSSVTFTDQSTGSPTGWKWTFTNGSPASSQSSNPTVVYNKAGSFTVKLVVTGAGGKDSITKSSYIGVNPLAVAGTVTTQEDSLCSGTATQLNVTGDTGTIQWQSSVNGAAFSNINGTSPTYNTVALFQTTWFRVKVQSGSCGTDSSAAQKIVVTQTPSAGVINATKDTICTGSIAHLSLSGNSSGTLLWQTSATANNFTSIPGATSAGYTSSPINAETNFRAVISNGGCADTSLIKTIHVLPAPVATFTDTIHNQDANFNSAGSTGATSYSWDFGDSSATSTDANPSHYFAKTGTFQVCLTVKNNTGCEFTQCESVAIINDGVNNILNAGDWHIYPNPSAGQLFISSPTSTVTNIDISIYDLTGRRCTENEMSMITVNVIQLNLSTLPEGMYMLRIRTAVNEIVKPILIQNKY